MWGNYVSLRLFMHKAHNKDRISSVRSFCGNHDYTNAKRNESAVIECDYNWKFFGVPRFFEETRARSFRQDKISSTPGIVLRAELINRGHEFAPPFRLFHHFLIILHAHSVLSSDFNDRNCMIAHSILVLLATTVWRTKD